LLLLSTFSKAQVGIDTTNPQGALDVSSPNLGLILPRVTSIEDVTDGSGNINSNENIQGLYKIYSLVGNNAVLELTFESGKVLEYDLTVNNEGATFLDDTRYFVLDTEGCD